MADIQCWTCGQFGHMSTSCPGPVKKHSSSYVAASADADKQVDSALHRVRQTAALLQGVRGKGQTSAVLSSTNETDVAQAARELIQHSLELDVAKRDHSHALQLCCLAVEAAQTDDVDELKLSNLPADEYDLSQLDASLSLSECLLSTSVCNRDSFTSTDKQPLPHAHSSKRDLAHLVVNKRPKEQIKLLALVRRPDEAHEEKSLDLVATVDGGAVRSTISMDAASTLGLQVNPHDVVYRTYFGAPALVDGITTATMQIGLITHTVDLLVSDSLSSRSVVLGRDLLGHFGVHTLLPAGVLRLPTGLQPQLQAAARYNRQLAALQRRTAAVREKRQQREVRQQSRSQTETIGHSVSHRRQLIRARTAGRSRVSAVRIGRSNSRLNDFPPASHELGESSSAEPAPVSELGLVGRPQPVDPGPDAADSGVVAMDASASALDRIHSDTEAASDVGFSCRVEEERGASAPAELCAAPDSGPQTELTNLQSGMAQAMPVNCGVDCFMPTPESSLAIRRALRPDEAPVERVEILAPVHEAEIDEGTVSPSSNDVEVAPLFLLSEDAEAAVSDEARGVDVTSDAVTFTAAVGHSAPLGSVADSISRIAGNDMVEEKLSPPPADDPADDPQLGTSLPVTVAQVISNQAALVEPSRGAETASAAYDLEAQDDAKAFQTAVVDRVGKVHRDADARARFLRAIAPARARNAAVDIGLGASPSFAEVSLSSVTTGSFVPERPVPPARQQAVLDYIRDRVKLGIIRRVPHAELRAAGFRQFNFPLHAVRKKDPAGQWTKTRVCGDLRSINKQIRDVPGGLPRISDILADQRGSSIFSLIDLESGFHQLPIAACDRSKLQFSYDNEVYEYQRAPYGLKHLPSHFQRTMETILRDCLSFCSIYIDDITIRSTTWREHTSHVIKVLDAFTAANIRISLEKSHFGFERIPLLGHIVDGAGVDVPAKKLEELDSYPIPTSAADIKSFLGFTAFLSSFVPHHSSLAAPLHRLAAQKGRRGRPLTRAQFKAAWDRDPQYRQSFNALLAVLRDPISLSHFNPDADEIYLSTDASRYGMSACLFQVVDGRQELVQCCGKTFNAAQRNYSATKRELLAILFGCQRLSHLLTGIKFVVLTDHKALTTLLDKQPLPNVLLNWLHTLASFDFDIRWVPGQLLLLPDRLSRLYWHLPAFDRKARRCLVGATNAADREAAEIYAAAHPTASPVRLWALSSSASSSSSAPSVAVQPAPPVSPSPARSRRISDFLRDPDGIMARVTALASEVPADFDAENQEEHLLPDGRPFGAALDEALFDHHDVVLRERELQAGSAQRPTALEVSRFVKQVALKRHPIDSAHSARLVAAAHAQGHFGSNYTSAFLFRSGWFWPEMAKACAAEAARCDRCISFNVGARGYHPLMPVNATYPWDTVSVDLAYLDTTPDGHVGFLVLRDIASRFIVARPLKDFKASTVARELWDVFSLFGIPRVFISDNGPEFRSLLTVALTVLLRIDKRCSTPLNPQSNGASESAVREVKVQLRKLCQGDVWTNHLYAAVFHLNHVKANRRTGATPASLMFGRCSNHFDPALTDTTDAPASELETPERAQARWRLLRDIIYPATANHVKAYNQQVAALTRRRHRAKPLSIGDVVTRADRYKTRKSEATWMGRYEVVARRGNSYILKDLTGVAPVYKPIPIQDIKLIRPATEPAAKLTLPADGRPEAEANEFGTVKRILADRVTPAGRRQYFVQWHGCDEKSPLNQWLNPDDFCNDFVVANYIRYLAKRGEHLQELKSDITARTLPVSQLHPTSFGRPPRGRRQRSRAQAIDEVMAVSSKDMDTTA